MSVIKLRHQSHLLECSKCRKRTTALEAELRKYNTNRCGYCNGPLECAHKESPK